MPEQEEVELVTEPRESSDGAGRNFAFGLAAVAVLVAAVPFLLGTLAAPAGGAYLGYQYATDDHMVYAAWMHQAMQGRFLFDNRFTIDPQPGLTLHLYFLVLGWVAKLTGISLASNLARLGFGALAIIQLFRLTERTGWDLRARKLATITAAVGGGCGFLVWQLFGEEVVGSNPLKEILLGRLPTDVWQPEGFFFPSLLTNGLFMVSLCLILGILDSILAAQTNPKAVVPGALCFGLLMNIHSYDVLLLALVLVAFLAASFSHKQVTREWILRAVLIVLGVVPAALWFAYVLKNDPVFQARAATETFSPNFRSILFGYLPLIAVALAGIASRTNNLSIARKGGVALMTLLIGAFFVMATGHASGYFLSPPLFALFFLGAIGAVVLVAEDRPAWNLIVAWAFIGTIAMYFPGLFQRKLAMGLAIPWGLLAGSTISDWVKGQSKVLRLAVSAVAVVLFGASSLKWLSRELEFISSNASRTSVHTVFLSDEIVNILAYLDKQTGRHVVIAPPGVPSGLFRSGTQETGPRDQLTPIIPDYNAIASGLAGVYSVAGHWSETPKYNVYRGVVSSIFFDPNMSLEDRKVNIKASGVDFVIAPVPEAFPGSNAFDFRQIGEVVVPGKRFQLVHLR